MTQDFYRGKLAEYGVEVLIRASEIETVNQGDLRGTVPGILSETSKGGILNNHRPFKERGAGGDPCGSAEIGLLVKRQGTRIVPLFDTALIHAEKAAELSVCG